MTSGGSAERFEGAAGGAASSALIDRLPGAALMVVRADLSVALCAGRALGGGRFTRDLVGADLRSAVGADHPAELERACLMAFEGQEVSLQCPTLKGERTFLVRMAPLDAGDGDPTLLALWTDISENARELERHQDRADELQLIWSASRSLARSTYPDETRSMVCGVAQQVSGADAVILFEPDEDGTALRSTAAQGLEGPLGELPMNEHSGATLALRTNTQRFGADARAEPSAVRALLSQRGLSSVFWQPVSRGRTVRAVLALGWTAERDEVGERTARLMDFVAVEAAVAIDRGAAIERLVGLARTDALTGLANRRAWEDELAREIARATRDGTPLSIALLDLDGFKAYNDTHGHAAGDQVLQLTAAAWTPRLRATDVLARWGGDEFGLALPNCGLEEGSELLSRLLAGTAGGLSCSAGVVCWDGTEVASQLLGRADRALYRAKAAGGGAIYVDG